MNDALDLLIESSAVSGQLAAGVSPARVAAHSSLGARAMVVLADRQGRKIKKAKQPKWTPDEDRFVEACMESLTDDEIGAALGRTGQAVHVRRERELGLPVRSKLPTVMSTEQVAQGLCKDGKSIHKLFDRGVLPGWRMPGVMNIRLVNKMRLLMWLTNPMNWVYFNPLLVGGPGGFRRSKIYDKEFWKRARRLVRKRRKLWKDEWWPIGRVARYRGIDDRPVNNAARAGKLPAVDWGNWWILRSHATDRNIKLQAWAGSGGKGQDHTNISSAAKAFMLLGASVGLLYKEIAGLMGFTEKQVYYQVLRMRREGRIPELIKRHGLKVGYDRETGETFASWRVYAHRFPRLARMMESGPDGRTQPVKKQMTIIRKKTERWSGFIRKKMGLLAA